MLTFALITEGITDQVAIESLLIGYYANEVETRFIQPIRDATDENRQGNFAGWEKVVEHCSRNIEDIFLTNDYLIIQIDTDICNHANINISFTKDGEDKPVDELVDEVKKFLISKISNGIYEKYEHQIIFAICVHSLECWLLPLHSNEKSVYSKTRSCETHLQKCLDKKNISYKKNHDCYIILSKDYEKRKIIDEKLKKNRSLEIFINLLPSVKI